MSKMMDRVAVGAKCFDKLHHQPERVVEGLQLGDLAADMHVDAGDAHAGKACGMLVHCLGAPPGDAELVFLLAGRDLGVGLRIDIGI